MIRCKDCVYFSHEGENGYGQCDLSYKERYWDTLCEGLECKRKPKEKEIAKKEIDWEQRRYEIAKDMFIVNYAKIIDTVEHIAVVSVHHADILIEELKKTSK